MNDPGSTSRPLRNIALHRRDVLHHLLRLTAGGSLLAGWPAGALAETPYPTRPVHVLLGFSAGGSSDIIGRLLCQWISERMGKAFVFDDHPGAASNIATEIVSREPPDGYSLLWCTSANAINATLYQI